MANNYSFNEARSIYEKKLKPVLRSVELLQLGALGTSWTEDPNAPLEEHKGKLGERFLRNFFNASKDRKSGHDMILDAGAKFEAKFRCLAPAPNKAYIASVVEGDVKRCTADYLAVIAYVPPLDKLELFMYSQETLSALKSVTIRYSLSEGEFTEKGGKHHRVYLPDDLRSIGLQPVREELKKLSKEELLRLLEEGQ